MGNLCRPNIIFDVLANAETGGRGGLLPARFSGTKRPKRFLVLDIGTSASSHNMWFLFYIFNADGGRGRRRLDININRRAPLC